MPKMSGGFRPVKRPRTGTSSNTFWGAAAGWKKPAAAAASAVLSDLLAGAAGKIPAMIKPTPPSVALKGTALKSYLDKTYEKKCGVEVKHYYIGPAGNITTSLALSSIFPENLALAQGLKDNDRVGTKIEVKDLKLHFSLYPNVANTATCRIRLILLKVGEVSAGTTPTGAQILADPTNIRSTLLDKDQQTVPYTIIFDRSYSVAPTATASSAGCRDSVFFDYYYKPKGCHEIVWTEADTTGATANITKGAMVLYSMYETAGTVGQPQWAYGAEFQYLDV